jgi:hypothetical protein
MLTCFKIILTEKNRRKFAVAYTAGKWVTIDTFCWRISHLGKIELDAHPQRTPKELLWKFSRSCLLGGRV